MITQEPSLSRKRLIAYFYSGWAFLIPYLLTYLLYAWLKWPVNPSGSWIPCLLHVYWFLHVTHLLLAGIALKLWWGTDGPHHNNATVEFHMEQAIIWRVWSLVPWLLLALIFWIPGVYLEWPSDPWEHLRRINEWRMVEVVTVHSSWTKSGYFIPFSLLNWERNGVRQILWLGFYQAGTSLLLCWQYYLLGKACDLGRRTSVLFVILQVVTFGNNLFSFYRYYGISSSIYAQLGAVALIRIALEAAKKKSPCNSRLLPSEQRSPFHFYSTLFSGLLLVLLIACNHLQGIGIAVLGITAVVVWRLIEWRLSMIGWLISIAVGLSVVVIFYFPRDTSLDQVYRSEGWLSAWYGFNLFSSSSPAFGRADQILGVPGALNLMAGFWLLRRNHIAAWLSIMPIIGLSLPFIAVPYLQLLVHDHQPVIVFHRMLFASPPALAFVTLLRVKINAGKKSRNPSGYLWSLSIPGTTFMRSISHRFRVQKKVTYSSPSKPKQFFFPACFPIILGIWALVLLPGSSPNFNRLYNLVILPPDDLSMHHVLLSVRTLAHQSVNIDRTDATFIATTGISFVANSIGQKNVAVPITRSVYALPRDKTVQSENNLVSAVKAHVPAIFLLQSANDLYTPFSLTAYLSQHWHPYEVAFEHSSGPEAEKIAIEWGYHKIETRHSVYYLYWPD